MSHHQSQGTYKHDRPAWRWRSTGVHAYTHDADAARYVALCRQREIDKMNRREAVATTQRLIAALTPPTITDSARLIAAAALVPDRRAAA
jgi:hypothetical protein